MSLLSAFWDAVFADPPQTPQLPPDQAVSRDMMEIVAERRALLIERDCYKLELRRLGFTEASLALRVKLYDQALKAEVTGRKSA